MMMNDSDGNEAFGSIINLVLCERELGLGTDNRSDVTVLSVVVISWICLTLVPLEDNDCFVMKTDTVQ